MTNPTTQGQKDSANTDLPQFHDPDDQVIGLDTDDTVPPGRRNRYPKRPRDGNNRD